MDTPAGWSPLRDPGRPPGGIGSTPFGRLALTHAASVAGDTLVTLALADSIFFGISPSDARPRVLLYLLLTMAPFSVVAPLLGPFMDRTHGGRRLMLVLAAAGRAFLCVLLIDDLDGLLLFPEAFGILVLSKSHAVARSALVPTLVRNHAELVEANGKLALVAGLSGFAVGLPGAVVLWLGGAPWVLGIGTVIFAAAVVAAVRLPNVQVATAPPDAAERHELRSAGVLLSASAMGLLRAIVGVMTFHLAFWLRSDDAPTWWFGLVIAVSALGGMAGSALAPQLRRAMHEENLLLAALVAVATVAVYASLSPSRVSAAVLAAMVGTATAAGKAAFDAIVQRDAPDANQGRSFARFETRFQLAWVAGGLVPVVLPLPGRVGFLVVAATAAFAASTYFTGQRALGGHAPAGPVAS